MDELEQETINRDEEKVKYLSEKLPPLQITGLQMEELQVSERYSSTYTANHQLVK